VEAQVPFPKECKERLQRLKNARREELEGRMEREKSMLGDWVRYRRR